MHPLAVCACGAYAVVDCLASCVFNKRPWILLEFEFGRKADDQAEKTILWNARRDALLRSSHERCEA